MTWSFIYIKIFNEINEIHNENMFKEDDLKVKRPNYKLLKYKDLLKKFWNSSETYKLIQSLNNWYIVSFRI